MKKKGLTEFEKVIVGLIAVVGFFPILITALILVNGFVLSTVWNWLVPKAFGLPEMSILQALVIWLIVSWLIYRPSEGKGGIRFIALGLMTDILTLVIAWILKGFL